MAIFNSYVKLPEGMFFSAAPHCDSRQTARWPWTDQRRSCGHRWCSWRFFGHPVPRWSHLVAACWTPVVTVGYHGPWYNQRQRQLVWSETLVRDIPTWGLENWGIEKCLESKGCPLLQILTHFDPGNMSAHWSSGWIMLRNQAIWVFKTRNVTTSYWLVLIWFPSSWMIHKFCDTPQYIGSNSI